MSNQEKRERMRRLALPFLAGVSTAAAGVTLFVSTFAKEPIAGPPAAAFVKASPVMAEKGTAKPPKRLAMFLR